MRTTIVASAGGALLAAAVLAVTVATPPAPSQAAAHPVQLSSGVVSSTTSRPAPPPLTDEQKALIDEYLAAHPGRAQHLADTAAAWKAFAEANPELAAELQKVAALPIAERKAELSSWFADHPEEKAAFKDWAKKTRDDRVDRRHERRDRRHDRRDRRHERRENRGGTTTPAPSPSGSAQTTATQA